MTHPRSKACALLAALFAVLCVLPASPALADETPTIAVAPFSSATKTKAKRKQAARARSAIIKALGNTGSAEFLNWTTVVNRAKRQYVTGAALEKPAKVGPIVGKLGGDVVIFGRIDKKNRLTLRITDKKGTPLWRKTIPLKKGVLSPAMAKKFAAAILAAAQVTLQEKAVKRPSRRAPPVEEAAPPPPPPRATLDSFDDDGQSPPPRSAPAREGARLDDGWDSGHDDAVRREDRRGSSSWDDDGGEWKSREGERRSDDNWKGGASSDDSSSPAAYDGDLGPQIVNVSADVSFTWRKYKFCNGVEKCGDVPVDGAGHSIDFGTSTPYLGFKLGLDLFPAARVSNRYLRGIGLVAGLRMNPGIKVTYSIGTDSEETELKGKEIDFSIDATYRFYYDLGFIRNGWVGLRLGYMRYGFTIDENPLFSSSSHGGFSMAIDAGFPLARYLTLDLGFAFQPSTAPGDDERVFFSNTGDAAEVAANGKGLKFNAGVSFPFSRYIGLNIAFDYTRYWSDLSKYKAESTDVIPATTVEQYIGLAIGLNGKF